MTRAIASLTKPCDVRQDVAGRTPPTGPGPERPHGFPGRVAGATVPTRPRRPVRIACRVIQSMKRASAGGEGVTPIVGGRDLPDSAGVRATRRPCTNVPIERKVPR